MITASGSNRYARIAVVTGGTNGIGRELARRLVREGYATMVVGRNEERGHALEGELRTIEPESRFVPGDLSSVDGIRNLALVISKYTARIDLIVHNAGIVDRRRKLSPDGIDQHFAINYFSRFVLQQYLSPLLSSHTDRSRSVVLLINGAAHGEPIRYQDILAGRTFGVLRAVRQFCRANDLFALRLYHEQLNGDSAAPRVACLKFGVVKTEIRQNFPWWMKLAVPVLDPWLAQTPVEAADAAMDVLRRVSVQASAPPLFTRIRRLRPYQPKADAAVPAAWDELWRFSGRLLDKLRSAPSRELAGSLPVGAD
ncbi:MAG TPA: SDR family NAD(P)-dependent oxidoreductase [Gemmatimonadaceae bacterium]|nr:SDR family NAD(P)-dependent oxidoreductase [Gemmatimonadaceae bacterium]